MTQPTDKKVTFEITFTVTDPAAMRAEALRCYLAAGGEEEDFIKNERSEDKIEDTPVGAWIMALFDHPREYGPGFSEHSYQVDSSKFYQPPPLPKGFDPATSVSGAQIAKLMTVALESDYWNDLEPVLPERFKSLAANPVWYADPALYETQQPWYFEVPNREYAGYDVAKNQVLHKDVVHKIGRADIIAAMANLAENRPRRIVEIMNGNIDVDLADIFFQTVVFKDYCYYH
ncbi:hypothetical protein M2175_004332 [Bradyrhizobium elkanii]|uniref:hypothetical protein n=1 Tax=Bradyrhizobium TaxID=374 RepID=UPI0005766451|nr:MULTISPECIES: hypothetical protein [Bradyrhizobium]MBR0914894.1 hypothetical protein [Bradyrhizobium japonicum]MCS3929301.1 hypothetical protein [Bradyrhizobium elkanii]MCS3969857.1 hypothetical protein [Bradyrhizobium japonicum]